MMKNLLLTLMLFLLTISVISAQTGIITGKITDSEKLPLIGANVIIKGTTIGTITDVDGNFRLTSIPTGKQIVVASFIGYNTEESEMDIKEGQTLTINFVLVEDVTTLDELVVVGYGTQKTKEVTSAITSVKAEEFNDGNIDNPIQLIQGKVAGLSISKPGGDPNADFNIRLRGLSTFGANTEPLIIVDGIQGVPLKSVDPNDIASMDVLKDASAAAIYGTKGASGVIIITTKKGQAGTEDKPVNVEFSSSFSITSIDKDLEVLSKDDYLKFPNSIDYGSETNWMDEITQKAAGQTYNLAASGGSAKNSYRIAFNYRDNEGVVVGTGFNQLSGRANITQKALNNKLTLDFNLNGSNRNETYKPKEALTATIKYNPTAPIYDDTSANSEIYGGYFQQNAYAFYNPVALIEQYTGDGQKTSVVGSLKGTLEPIKDLKISGFYSQDHMEELQGSYWSKYTYYPEKVREKGSAYREFEKNFTQMFESTVGYEKTVDKLKGSLLAGYSWQEKINEGFWAYAEGFLSDGFLYNNLGAGVSEGLPHAEQMDSWKSKQTLIGTFARGTFTYDETYFLNAIIRRDGSSMFGENNKWGTFYGVSGGVDLAKFMNVSQIGRMKVRGGIGTTGNLPPQPYLSKDLYSPATEKFYYNGTYIQAYKPVQNANPDLKWEVKKELNIGLDFGLFAYKLTGTIDYFKSNSTDLMLYFTVPTTNYPAEKMWYNLGELSNSGLEFAVSYKVIESNDFTWTTDFNFTKYFNTTLDKITTEKISSSGEIYLGELGAPGYTGVTTIKLFEGEEIGQIVGRVFTGLDSLGHYTYLQAMDTATGELTDVERAVLGNGLPDFQFGWGNTLTYKNFDLSFFFRGVFGHSIINTNNARYGSPTSINIQSGMNMALDYMDATVPPQFSDLYVEKANFVKLDNFSLGYNFNFEESKYVSKVRAYISGQNLFTITNYSGTSPEVRYTDTGDNNNPLAPGIDRGDTYFSTRTFTFGLNVTF